MFIACDDYVSYDVLPWIAIRLVILDIGDNGHSPPPQISPL
jgi:hypothetical protein